MKKRLYDADEMNSAIVRITDEILAAFPPEKGDPVLVGIHHLGVPLSERIRGEIARRTGGNLTEIFDRISETIRARMRIERRVRTLTAQGRMQGIIVSAMPFVLGAAMTALKPELMLPFLGSFKGVLCVAGAALLVTCGWLVIRRIVRIDV